MGGTTHSPCPWQQKTGLEYSGFGDGGLNILGVEISCVSHASETPIRAAPWEAIKTCHSLALYRPARMDSGLRVEGSECIVVQDATILIATGFE